MKSLFSVGVAAILLTSCNSESKKQEAALKAKQTTIDSMKTIMAKQAIIDSMNNVIAQQELKLQEEREENSKQIVANNNSPAQATIPAKKKWNHKAKGAVVGAGTGAVTGAIINKNRAEGALIGSVIGAGVGVGTGAIVDAQKKKKERNN